MEGSDVLVEIVPETGETESVSSSSSFRRRPSRSKSRIGESQNNGTTKLIDASANTIVPVSSPNYRHSPGTTLLASSSGGEDYQDEDDDEVYVTRQPKFVWRKHGKKIYVMLWIELIAIVCISGVVIASLTINKLTEAEIWSLELWKWGVLVLVIFCDRLVTRMFSEFLAFLIERNTGCFSKLLAILIDKNSLLKNVLYFLYELRNSMCVIIWLGLILLAWALLINRGVDRSPETEKTLNKITRGIACTLIGAALWTAKALLMELIASKVYVRTFFDRIQESIFHQYVLQTISGPPLKDEGGNGSSKARGRLTFNNVKEGKQKEGQIDVLKLHRIKREKVSAWTMSGLIAAIKSSRLLTISGEIGETNNELEAKEANTIFENVAGMKDKEYIDEKDLARFFPNKQVDDVLCLFEGTAETKQIEKLSFVNWVVNIYEERRCLARSLDSCKTAIEELNVVVSILVLIVVIIVWLLLMEITTTEVLVFISSQILLWGFMFGDSLKTLFQGIIFTFMVHPFDIGDECVFNTDGQKEEMLLVYDMKLTTTIFKNKDNEKIHYPNSILATQRIINRSRPKMDVAIDPVKKEGTSPEGQDKSVSR